MGEFRFKRGGPLPERFIEHLLSDASLSEIGQRWGLTEAAARYHRRKERERRGAPARAVEAWKHPVGTRVVVRTDSGEVLLTVTRSMPWVMGGHSAVILVEGIAGGYALERVTPVREVAEVRP